MEKYIDQTKGLLIVLKASLSEEELERSGEAGLEMWEALRKVSEEHQLSVREMLNAALCCNHEILELVNEQTKETKKEMGL